MDLDGPSYAPLSGGKAAYLVVLLHGLNANGADLIDLARNWRPILPEAEFLAPNAPFPCGPSSNGRQWFSVEDRAPAKMLAGLRRAAEILDPFLNQLLAERRLDESKLALVGFSQGAMMALHVGLRRKTAIAGIVAFSGALHGADVLAAEIRSRPPVLLIHGDADTVVPFASMASAQAALEAVAAPVKSVARPKLGHEIDEEGARLAGEFLCSALKPKIA